MKFVTPAGTFDITAYRRAVDILITAMDILVDNSGYPTEAIGRNSHDYRPLGLGYANLGALLMAFGLPYDSDAGRDFAACLTAIMCGQAYLQSSRVAEQCASLPAATPLTQSIERQGGTCPGFYVNREPFLDVIRMHRAEVNKIGRSHNGSDPFSVPQLDELIEASRDCWDKALAHGEKFGYRNSQVTVLAPTGTIGFMMDCDTTGVEPDLALVKYKKLVGGGMIKIVNNTVPAALFKLGYSNEDVDAIVSYIDATGTIEGAPGLKPEHLPVFDCSFKASKGTRSIHYMGHVRMMAATQPFISGAISKTVNLPNNASVEDIAEAYIESWRKGLKAVAVYRDGSKGTQPLNVTDSVASGGNSALDAVAEKLLQSIATLPIDNAAVEPLVAQLAAHSAERVQLPASSLETLARATMQNVSGLVLTQQDPNAPPRTVRHRLPEERPSLTHKFSIAGHEGYITVGLYPNGQPGEIFIKMAKEGSTVSGLMDAFATAISLSLQHGVPLKVLCEKFSHLRFEPSGWTGNEEIGFAKSIMDYIFRWLQLRFLSGTQLPLFAGLAAQAAAAEMGKAFVPEQHQPARGMGATTAPQGGILPDIHASHGQTQTSLHMEDRGLVHAADAMRGFVDMGDAPTCHTCGAIMVRNGSCYKCVECGSTSGCS